MAVPFFIYRQCWRKKRVTPILLGRSGHRALNPRDEIIMKSIWMAALAVMLAGCTAENPAGATDEENGGALGGGGRVVDEPILPNYVDENGGALGGGGRSGGEPILPDYVDENGGALGGGGRVEEEPVLFDSGDDNGGALGGGG